MISISVIDFSSRKPFPTFIHNTTTYVGVAHDARTLLYVSSDTEPCLLTLEAENRVVGDKGILIPQWGGDVELSRFKQPQQPAEPFRFDFSSLLSWVNRRQPPRQPETRLYAFRAMAAAQAEPETLLATVDFHLLCADDFRWAEGLHNELLKNPQALGHDTIWERAEGSCPVCAEIRARLQKDWRKKDSDNDE